jgi:hypothetical protein
MEELIHDSNILLYLRLINIVLITVCVCAWILFYKRYKLIMAIAPVTWLIHVLIYGIYRFSNTPRVFPITEYSELVMDVWTALIIMHGIILLLVSAIESTPAYQHPKKEKENKND